MYSILILDDEIYAVKALTETIDWQELNIDKVYGTSYLDEAIQILTEQQVDILLTDIVMPGKTGFDMVEFIHERRLNTKIIMATAHESFQFAQKALRMNVVDYLLKPIRFEALKKAVKTAIGQIEEEQEQQQSEEEYKKSRALWNSNIPLIIERFWRDVFASRAICDSERVIRFFRSIDQPLNELPEFLVMLISLDEWPAEDYEDDIINYGIRNLAQEIIVDVFGGKMLEDDDGNNIGVLYLDKNHAINDVEKECRRFMSYCNEHMYVKVSCYLSNIVQPEQVLNEYRDVLHIYWDKPNKGNAVIRKEELSEDESISTQQIRFLDIENPFDIIKKEQLIDEVEDFFRKNEYLSSDMLLQIHAGISFFAYSYCCKRGISIEKLIERINPKNLIHSKNKTKAWCIKVIDRVISEDNGESESEKIIAIKEYIKKNYMNHITRETISNELYFNASYLSRLFKKEIGMSIFEYLANVRIEEAQRMLTYTDKKISSIAMDVGYNHFSHFANIFRRITGLTPKDYREQSKAGHKKSTEE